MNENLKIRLRSECLNDDLIRVFDSGIGKIAVYPSVNDDDCFLQEIFKDLTESRNDILAVFYHREFTIKRDDIIREDDLREYYQGEKIEQTKKYHIFPLSALIHSSIHFSLSDYFSSDPQGFDTSTAGAVLIRKKKGLTYKKALDLAYDFVNELNKIVNNEFVNLEAWLLTTSENEDYDFEATEFLSGMMSEIDNLNSDLNHFVEQLKGELGEQLSLSF